MDTLFDSVSFVGAGNVATHLAQNLKKQGVSIYSITSKENQTAKVLASAVDAKVLEDLSLLPSHCLVIICVKDQAIESIVQKIPLPNSIVYTSGNIELNLLPKRANLGVFYPLQSFTKNRDLNLSNVPFLIESNNELFRNKIYVLIFIRFEKQIDILSFLMFIVYSTSFLREYTKKFLDVDLAAVQVMRVKAMLAVASAEGKGAEVSSLLKQVEAQVRIGTA
jgi:hypothetical protein